MTEKQSDYARRMANARRASAARQAKMRITEDKPKWDADAAIVRLKKMLKEHYR